MKIRNNDADLEEYFELDVLRGWREVHDSRLLAAHALPALGALVQQDSEGHEIERIAIHGPDVILGRFQPQQGPVDLVPCRLLDHENYRLGVPHIYLRYDENGWGIRVLTTASATRLCGEMLDDCDRYYGLIDGDVLELGVVSYVFESYEKYLPAWQHAREEMLKQEREPSIFLKRNGGMCGARFRLTRDKSQVIGRTFARKGEIPGTKGWLDASAPDWDLAGLSERERKHIGFRHARVGFVDGHWCIEPMSQRQWTFVNRFRVRGLTRLKAGDEIGLGTVLFSFHDGESVEELVELHESGIELPDVVTWNEGHIATSISRRRNGSKERT